jgi:hypothetical protein
VKRFVLAASLALGILAGEATGATLAYMGAVALTDDLATIAFATAVGFLVGAFLCAAAVVHVECAPVEADDIPLGIGA